MLAGVEDMTEEEPTANIKQYCRMKLLSIFFF